MVNDIREWYWGMILVKDKGKIRKKGGNFKKSNSNAYILGWILSNVNVEITENSSQILQFSYGVFLGSIVILFFFVKYNRLSYNKLFTRKSGIRKEIS